MLDLSSLLNTLPDDIGAAIAMFIVACKLITVFVRPPASGSRWQLPYRAISTLALNVGWATNRLQAGHTSSSSNAPSSKT